MKRVIAIIGIILALSVMFGGVRDVDGAKTWLELTRGVFWIVLGGFAFSSFVDDFKENKWPLQ